MKIKNILLIGNYPPPFGGVPRHIEYLSEYLVENGWNVHVLSGGNSGIEYKNNLTVYKPDRLTKVSSILSNIIFIIKVCTSFLSTIKDYSLNDYLRIVSYVSLGRQIIKNRGINVISAYNLYSYAPIGAILSKDCNIPLVVTNFGEIFSMDTFFRNNRELVRSITNIAQVNLSMSFHCAKSYHRIGLSPKIQIIPYGVDVNKFSPSIDGNIIKDKLSISRSENIVLFVGRLIKDMGLHTVLESIPKVLQRNNNVTFIIVGGKGDLFESALNIAEVYKNKVQIFPGVPFDDLPLYYAASTIVIAPTQGERACGSLAAIEAMSSGKPVIAANVGGIPEIVFDKENGILIPPEDPVALQEAILYLLDDERLIRSMGASSRKRVENYFDEHKTDQTIENIFNKLIAV